MLAFASCCALAVPLEGHSAAQQRSASAQLSSAHIRAAQVQGYHTALANHAPRRETLAEQTRHWIGGVLKERSGREVDAHVPASLIVSKEERQRVR